MIIYKTTNLINEKIYIGKDKHNNPSYYGSGKLLILAIKKYGKHNFKKEIIEECHSLEELNKSEIYWIEKLDATNKEIGYNLLKGGDGGAIFGRVLSEETKQKISNSLKGHIVLQDTRTLIKQNNKGVSRNKGKKVLDETKEKLRSINLGKKLSIETKNKMSDAKKNLPIKHLIDQAPWNKGKTLSDETKNKISKSKKGKSYGKIKFLSNETKNKISDSLKGKKQSQETINKRLSTMGVVWNKGKIMSDESKHKMSESSKGKNPFLNMKEGICEHCGIKMKMSHLNRYHNNNCKYKN